MVVDEGGVDRLAIASVLGIAIAIAMSLAEWIELSLWPYAVALQCVPILALTPLIGALLGFGFEARVVVTVMFALSRSSRTHFSICCQWRLGSTTCSRWHRCRARHA